MSEAHEAHVRAVFRAHDYDASQTLTRGELGAALRDLGICVSEPELETLLRKVDTDGSDDLDSSTKSSRGGKKSPRSSVSPINMENQEKIKLERKRMRNRVAASKCRKRKLERISLLDDRVKALKGENAELAAVVKKLKAAVCDLKQEVMEHVHNGCEIMIAEDSAAFS